jgi:predicted acyl esterase
MRKTAAAVAACCALLAPTTASAAPPSPFGHACSPQNGVLFCPASTLDDRVPSWDGLPLDVDVTLPESGDGPFPTIVMLHGLGGTKRAFESADETGSPSVQRFHYNNVFYAKRGYAVVNLTARGDGNSCGKPESRTSPGCDRGWMHLDDQAFEAHDVQYLVGLLVDQGIAQPDALGVTGVSYGGGISNTLAYLRDRVRTPEGALIPWTSPNGTPLRLAAAWGRWGWADLTYSLVPNGRFLDTKKWKLGQALQPKGIMKKSFVGGLYLITTLNFIAPLGADANAPLTEGKNALDKGEPYGTELQLIGGVLSSRKSAAGLFGSTPSPLLLQNGWTDDLFPVNEALMIYNDTDHGAKGPVSLQFGDFGHGRGSEKLGEEQYFNDKGAAFFDAYLKKQGTPPAAGSIDVTTQTCPNTATAGGPLSAASWAAIHPGKFTLAGPTAQRVTSSGGDPTAAKTFDKVLGANPCETAAAGKGKGVARYSKTVKKGFTMIGLPTVKATIETKGKYGELAARLYDISNGKETLVTRGQYRLNDNQTGKITFQLNGNAYKFVKGHTLQLELLGQDPNYLRKSNGTFRISVSKLTLSVPTRERKPV